MEFNCPERSFLVIRHMSSVCCMGEREIMLNKQEVGIQRLLRSGVFVTKTVIFLSPLCDIVKSLLPYCCKILVEAKS